MYSYMLQINVKYMFIYFVSNRFVYSLKTYIQTIYLPDTSMSLYDIYTLFILFGDV